MSEELKIVTNQPTELKLSNNETILIYPFRFKDFAKVIQILSNYANVINSLESADGLALMQLLSEDEGEGLLKAMQLSCRNKQDAEFWDNLELDDAAAILACVVEKNTTFFKEKVSPNFEKMGKVLNPQKIEQNGSTNKPEAESMPETEETKELASVK